MEALQEFFRIMILVKEMEEAQNKIHYLKSELVQANHRSKDRMQYFRK